MSSLASQVNNWGNITVYVLPGFCTYTGTAQAGKPHAVSDVLIHLEHLKFSKCLHNYFTL